MRLRGKRTRKRASREPAQVRWAFYLLFLFFFCAMFYYSIAYENDLQAGNSVAAQSDLAWSTITTSFLFPSATIGYLLFRGYRLKALPKALGLSKDKLTRNTITYGIALAAAIIILEIAIAGYGVLTNTQIPSTNTAALLAGMPISFLFFTVFISPINEEIFFRGLLVPRIGVILSAIIFAIFHLGYGSITEVGGVVAYGLLAGYVYKRKGSLYSTIIGHMLVNLLAVTPFL